VFYARAQSLFRVLGLARAGGSLRHLLAKFERTDVMVIDDWAMAPLAEAERRDFWEICEERYQTRSTILTSQLPISRWHEQIGDPTLADGILDRLVHNAHRIEMKRRFHAKAREGVAHTARRPAFASLRTPFLLTKPNTSRTIAKPASLRSDQRSTLSRNRVQFPPGMAFSFPGIRNHRQLIVNNRGLLSRVNLL